MRGTILVAGDEEELCRLFTESLTRQGLKVVAARSGREALALGVREFLGKPFALDRLLRIVVEEVEGRTLRPAG